MTEAKIERCPALPDQRGFTLVEISMVLIVIGLIIGAVSIGQDLQRNAGYQAIQSVFVQSWSSAYQNYHGRVGIVVGDSPGTPTGEVNSENGGVEYCGVDLVRELQAAGVQAPDGRGPGSETRYGYQDSNGNPQEAVVCFVNTRWSVPDGTGGYEERQRNVMVIRGLTPDLAQYLDSRIDGRVDARFGQFREDSRSDNTTATTRDWSLDSTAVYGGGTATGGDEHQVAVLTAYYLMNP